VSACVCVGSRFRIGDVIVTVKVAVVVVVVIVVILIRRGVRR